MDTISLPAYNDKPRKSFFKRTIYKIKAVIHFSRTMLVLAKKIFML